MGVDELQMIQAFLTGLEPLDDVDELGILVLWVGPEGDIAGVGATAEAARVDALDRALQGVCLDDEGYALGDVLSDAVEGHGALQVRVLGREALVGLAGLCRPHRVSVVGLLGAIGASHGSPATRDWPRCDP